MPSALKPNLDFDFKADGKSFERGVLIIAYGKLCRFFQRVSLRWITLPNNGNL